MLAGRLLEFIPAPFMKKLRHGGKCRTENRLDFIPFEEVSLCGRLCDLCPHGNRLRVFYVALPAPQSSFFLLAQIQQPVSIQAHCRRTPGISHLGSQQRSRKKSEEFFPPVE